MAELKDSLLCMDATRDQLFEGYATGDLWNGFACPYFTFDQAQAIVSAWLAHGWQAHYDELKDAFVFSVNQDFATGHSDEFDTFRPVFVDGQRLYPIGAFSWAWEQADLAVSS